MLSLDNLDVRALKEGYFSKYGEYKISSLKPLDKINIISSKKSMYILSIYYMDAIHLFQSCPVVRIFLKELFVDFIIYNDTLTLWFDEDRNANYIKRIVDRLIYFYELEREDCYV